MRSSLYGKFILGYLLFGLLSFFFVATIVDHAVETELIRQKTESLTAAAGILSDRYESSGAYISAMTLEITRELGLVAESTDTMIWLVSPDGRITYDTSDRYLTQDIPSFDPETYDKTVSTMGGLLPEAHICALDSVESNFSVLGYICLNCPVSKALAGKNSIMLLIYTTLGVIFTLSLILLLIFHFPVYGPIRKITAAAREYAKGNLNHRISVGSRKDEMQTLSETLNYMAEEQSNLEKHQRDFVSNVSHDFRSPLTSIKGFLEAILDGTIPPEMYGKYITRVIGETNRLSKLTEEMLTLGNLDSKGLLNRSVFDINRTIRDICASNETSCLDKNLSFDLLFENNTEKVYADHEKIQRVLYNLIDNAIKFSYPGSSITISTAARQKKIYVSIRDHGEGIPRSSLKKVWDRFYKTDTSRGKDKQGTGLGLSIVKEIITAHNETIDVISTEKVGTEFTFSLPQAEEKGERL